MLNLEVVALTVALATAVSWFWRAYKVDIPKNSWLYKVAWVMSLLLGAIALYLETGTSIAWWAVGLSTMFLYLIFTGAQKTSDKMLRVGDVMPVFSSVDDNGVEFNSESLRGSRLLVKFFRGHW